MSHGISDLPRTQKSSRGFYKRVTDDREFSKMFLALRGGNMRHVSILLVVALAIIVVLAATTSCHKAQQPAKHPIEGAWKIVEIRNVGPEGVAVNPAPQPSLYVFTAGHYSMMWIPGREPRQGSAKTWFPTYDEKVKDFETVIMNSGTYELTDTTVTIHPLIAKTPEYVGGKGVFVYGIVADTLWLTNVDIYSSDGTQDPYITQYTSPLKLVRVE